jgi:uncharacterized cupredoxin-like copper-binding protein
MRKAAALLALGLFATVLVACGGGSDDSSSNDVSTYCPSGNKLAQSSSGPTLVVTADTSGAPRFKPTSLSAKAGNLTIELDNPSPKCHDIAVKGEGGEAIGHTDRVKQGKASVNLDLQPGKYSYYSTIPGEQDAGMLGTLTVK